MTDAVTGDAGRRQPAPVNLTGIDPYHPEQESPEHLLSTTVAETAAAMTGVHHLGGVAARTLDRARRQVPGTSSAPGVTVAVEDGTTVIDLDIVVEYPHAIDDVVDETRVQVAHAARQLTASPVSVNITVTDIHGPFDQDPGILDAIDQAGEKARDLRDQAGKTTQDLRDRAAATTDDLRDQADVKIAEMRQKAGGLKGQISDTASDLRDQAGAIASDARDKVDEFAAKVDASQAQAEAKVDEMAEPISDAAQTVGGDTARLEAKADQKLDELDEKTDQKLNELDDAARDYQPPADDHRP